MLEAIVWTLATFALVAVAAVTGAAIERRRSATRDAARAECVECSYSGDAKPLSVALSAAERHKSATGHPVMVVSAWK